MRQPSSLSIPSSRGSENPPFDSSRANIPACTSANRSWRESLANLFRAHRGKDAIVVYYKANEFPGYNEYPIYISVVCFEGKSLVYICRARRLRMLLNLSSFALDSVCFFCGSIAAVVQRRSSYVDLCSLRATYLRVSIYHS